MYLLLVFALAGCNTVSEDQWNTAQTAFSGSSSLRAHAIQDCVANQKHLSFTKKKMLADLTGASIDKYPTILCSRVINAISSGRMTYEDYKKSEKSDADNSNVVRIMQGR